MGILNMNNKNVKEINEKYNNWINDPKLTQEFYSKLDPKQIEFLKLYKNICENASEAEKEVVMAVYQLYILDHYKKPKKILNATINDIKQELDIIEVTPFDITKYILMNGGGRKVSFFDVFPITLAQRNNKFFLYTNFVIALTAALMNIRIIFRRYYYLPKNMFVITSIIKILIISILLWYVISLGKAIYMKIKYSL